MCDISIIGTSVAHPDLLYWPMVNIGLYLSFYIVRENKKCISLLIIDLTQSGVLAEGSDRLINP